MTWKRSWPYSPIAYWWMILSQVKSFCDVVPWDINLSKSTKKGMCCSEGKKPGIYNIYIWPKYGNVFLTDPLLFILSKGLPLHSVPGSCQSSIRSWTFAVSFSQLSGFVNFYNFVIHYWFLSIVIYPLLFILSKGLPLHSVPGFGQSNLWSWKLRWTLHSHHSKEEPQCIDQCEKLRLWNDHNRDYEVDHR